jgi:hypothetical protein
MTERGAGMARVFLTSTLIASMLASLLCGVARGDDRSAGESFRIRATAFGPIGKVFSLGEAWINRRLARGEQPVWPGDLIEVSRTGGANVVLDPIGHIALSQGTAIRLRTCTASPGHCTGGGALIISLIAGEVRVKLQAGGSARVEAVASQFISSKGASFRIGIHEGQPLLDVSQGSVWNDSDSLQRDWVVIRVNADPLTGKPRGGAASSKIKVVVDKKEFLFFQVLERDRITGRTSPAGPRRTVGASLSKPVGHFHAQSVTVPTNDYGVAPVTFTAGHNPDSAEVIALDEASGAEWKGTIDVVKAPGFWRPRNIALISAAAAAVVVIIVDKLPKPLRQEPPPIIP